MELLPNKQAAAIIMNLEAARGRPDKDAVAVWLTTAANLMCAHVDCTRAFLLLTIPRFAKQHRVQPAQGRDLAKLNGGGGGDLNGACICLRQVALDAFCMGMAWRQARGKAWPASWRGVRNCKAPVASKRGALPCAVERCHQRGIVQPCLALHPGGTGVHSSDLHAWVCPEQIVGCWNLYAVSRSAVMSAPEKPAGCSSCWLRQLQIPLRHVAAPAMR